jgi:hypothetical protein
MNLQQWNIERFLLSMVAGDLDYHAHSITTPPLPCLDLGRPDHVIVWTCLWRVLRGPNFAPTLQKRINFYLIYCFGVVIVSSIMSSFAGDAIAAVGAENIFELDSPTRTAYSAAGSLRLLSLSIGLGVVVTLSTVVDAYGKKHLAAIDRAATAARARAASMKKSCQEREDLVNASELLVLLRNELVSIFPLCCFLPSTPPAILELRARIHPHVLLMLTISPIRRNRRTATTRFASVLSPPVSSCFPRSSPCSPSCYTTIWLPSVSYPRFLLLRIVRFEAHCSRTCPSLA